MSIAAHVALMAVVVNLAKPDRPAVPRAPKDVGRLVHFIYVPPATELKLPPRLRAPDAVREAAVPALEPPPPVPSPAREIEHRVVETAKAVDVLPAEVAPRPVPPTPAPPQPTVGMFPESKPVAAKTPELNQRIEAAGFNVPAQAPVHVQRGQATLGAFDVAPKGGPHRQDDQPTDRNVASAGFNQASVAVPASQPGSIVRDTGFGSAPARQKPAAAAPPAEVKGSGFADARVTQPVKRAAAAAASPAVVAVEVLSKPTPVYTEEGRRLKVEGEVVLEVEFAAAGSLRVLRVVRGLGYGLDEAAVRAAEQIRFRPATSEGRPVDYRTTVQIVFRLA